MAILNFQKPDKIILQKATDFEAQFEFRPLEPGYGVTIGNALRRVLLNSLEGYAIVGVKIEGVDHEQFSELWNMIHNEFDLTQQYILKLTGHQELMADYPVDQLSIQMRERIVLPLVTIQQYGLTKIREMDEPSPMKEIYEKLIMRCSFGIINAGRNSA